MNRITRKQIVYVDKEYFDYLCDEYNARTREERDKVINRLMDTITAFLDSKKPCDTLFTNKFIDKEGKCRKAIEISPVIFSDNKKTLHYLRKTNRRQ